MVEYNWSKVVLDMVKSMTKGDELVLNITTPTINKYSQKFVLLLYDDWWRC